mmetsp:Transcript_24294/g.36443  ORF Transcript_24294/g.36443 Transcript_24294/m.36443 type:complete len:350 (+) Transcript_24294:8-1057(+)
MADDEPERTPCTDFAVLHPRIVYSGVVALALFPFFSVINLFLSAWSFELYFEFHNTGSCTKYLRNFLFVQGWMHFVTGILLVLLCFCSRAIFRHASIVAEYLEPHWNKYRDSEDSKRQRLGADTGAGRNKSIKKATVVGLGTGNDEEDVEFAAERSLLRKRLSREQSERVTDNAALACCGGCGFVFLEVAKNILMWIILGKVLLTHCSDNNEDLRKSATELIGRTQTLLIVAFSSEFLTLVFYIFAYRLCCNTCEVLPAHQRVRKYLQNKAVERFWRNEKHHKTRRRRAIQKQPFMASSRESSVVGRSVDSKHGDITSAPGTPHTPTRTLVRNLHGHTARLVSDARGYR